MGIDEIINVTPYDEKWTALFQNEKVNLDTIAEELAKRRLLLYLLEYLSV
jgi:hypothetical protein